MSLLFCYAIKLTQVKFPQNLSAPPQGKDRKRKRAQEPEESSVCAPTERLRKRPRTSVARSAFGDTFSPLAADGVADNKVNPIAYWIQEKRWPKDCFDQDDQTREDFRKDFEKDSWLEKYWEPENNLNHLPARKKSSSFLRSNQSETSFATTSCTTPSGRKSRAANDVPYQDPRYETLLATKGSFMDESELGITDASRSLCQTLFKKKQTVPQESLFRDDLFRKTCEDIRHRNKARVLQDITRLIVPSAETLAVFGAKHLEILIESVNEGWNNSIPVTKPRPQPDYSVGFSREAFTEDQLKRLGPFVGNITDISFFMATYYMYFPFLTCEVECGLDIADRRNAHSMTMAVRGIVNLFRLVKREKELHREILAFSVSHDHTSVRIYGHYPIIDGPNTTFYRHPIHMFSFTALDGKEKWTTYKFTRNVYDIWMPTHFKRICSVIDQLPANINFNVPELQSSEASRLSQFFDNQSLLQQSNPDMTSLVGTPNTSLPCGTEPRAFKKSKKRCAEE